MSVLEICDVNRRTDVAFERAIRQEPWNSLIEDPSVFPIRPAQPVLHLEALACVKGRTVCCEATIQVLRMYARRPTASEFFTHTAARKIQPSLAKEGAQFVDIGTPNHYWCGVRHEPEAPFTFAKFSSSFVYQCFEVSAKPAQLHVRAHARQQFLEL